MALGRPPAEGDADQSTAIRIYPGTLIAFTILIVLLRLIVRKWITKIIGWDDWTILLALVSLFGQYSQNHILLRLYTGWECNRLRIGSCRNTLWLWETTILPHKQRSDQVSQIRIWRMDPDIRYFDVDQSLNMPFPKAHPRHQNPHQAT